MTGTGPFNPKCCCSVSLFENPGECLWRRLEAVARLDGGWKVPKLAECSSEELPALF
jgi:hypothetical protein